MGLKVWAALLFGLALGFSIWRLSKSGSPTLSLPTTTATTTLPSKTIPSAAQTSNHIDEGNRHMDRGRYDLAALSFERALKMRFDVDVTADLGICYRHLGDRAKAIVTFRRALRAQPDHWQARYNLAVVLIETGEFAQASSMIQQLKRERPTDPTIMDLEKALTQVLERL